MENVVETALGIGYRLFDTAYNYGNEESLGKSLKKWINAGGKREDLFITTKVSNILYYRPFHKLYLSRVEFTWPAYDEEQQLG